MGTGYRLITEGMVVRGDDTPDFTPHSSVRDSPRAADAPAAVDWRPLPDPYDGDYELSRDGLARSWKARGYAARGGARAAAPTVLRPFTPAGAERPCLNVARKDGRRVVVAVEDLMALCFPEGHA